MTKVIKFNEFMSGEYKVKVKQKKQKIIKNTAKLAAASILPITTCGTIGTLGFAMKTFACTTNIAVPASAQVAIPVNASEWLGQQTLHALAHILDPVIDILVALSLPVASVVIVGSCFFFIFGKAEKAWTSIQNAGLGYVLIQVSPLILNVLKQVGNAV